MTVVSDFKKKVIEAEDVSCSVVSCSSRHHAVTSTIGEEHCADKKVRSFFFNSERKIGFSHNSILANRGKGHNIHPYSTR